jgi:hypothetical protein
MNIELLKLIMQMFGLAVVRRLFHAGRRDILPRRGEPYDHRRVYHAQFYQVDNHLHDIPNHPEAHLWPSAVVTLGIR